MTHEEEAEGLSWYQAGKRPDAVMPDTLWRAGRRVLREAEALVRQSQPSLDVTTQEVEGVPAVVLREKAKDAVELVGDRQPWPRRVQLRVVHAWQLPVHAFALLGSVGRGVLHHARCPVAVVRA
ncbi:hypothetical protein [Nonomuraea lactucae]|uniref:hypothetical protein n=1 Tax=Nonomuraea lactucae TaxID=2249762 RepID=UPI000DE3C8B4|nr:hypothetical protein [Nonomuraea lactucae]